MRKIQAKTKLSSNQKGITLIALVITIIVLLILAGVAISMLSGENGILKQAAESKTQTEEQSTVEAMKLAGITALTAGEGSVENDSYYNTLNNKLKELGYQGTITNETKLPIEEIEVKGEHFTIKENGEVVHLAWWYIGENKDKITNGTVEISLGDTIDYNPTEGITKDANRVYKQYESKPEKNGYGTDSQIFKIENNDEGKQKLTWIVLGTDENGDILIIPTQNIKDASGTPQYFNLKGQVGVKYGPEEINNIASIYGYGKGAKSARSIQVDDMNKLTGFNPNDVGEGKRFASGNIAEYGNKVTYSWTETQNKVSTVGSNKKTGSGAYSTYATNGFNWYNQATKSWKKSTQDIKNPKEITTLTGTYYYYGLDITNCKNETLYNAVAGQYGEIEYWLSSQFINLDSGIAGWGVRSVWGSSVDVLDLYLSDGGSYEQMSCIRPAVSLKSDITLAPNGTNAWKIK